MHILCHNENLFLYIDSCAVNFAFFTSSISAGIFQNFKMQSSTLGGIKNQGRKRSALTTISCQSTLNANRPGGYRPFARLTLIPDSIGVLREDIRVSLYFHHACKLRPSINAWWVPRLVELDRSEVVASVTLRCTRQSCFYIIQFLSFFFYRRKQIDSCSFFIFKSKIYHIT